MGTEHNDQRRHQRMAAERLAGSQPEHDAALREHLAVHIKDTIGMQRIKAIGPYDIEQYLRRLKASGLSEASVRQTRALLGRACTLARKWSGGRLVNPVTGTEMPEWS